MIRTLFAALLVASVTAGFGVVASAPAVAQDASAATPMFIKKQRPNQYLAKDKLIGAKIRDPQGKIIGDVEDLVLNFNDRVVGIVMGVGGALGFGEKRIAVRLAALETREFKGKPSLVLDTTREDLKAMKAFVRLAPRKSLLERAKEKARELADKTKATASDAYKKAKDATKKGIDRAKELSRDAIEKAKERVKPADQQSN
ncbi:MAG: PRC-barrel domain-containing protein [Pseudomonadota bacterium]